MSMRVIAAIIAVCFAGGHQALPAEDRDAKVHQDRQNVTEIGRWIYNDLQAGQTQARQERKPMLIALRCIP